MSETPATLTENLAHRALDECLISLLDTLGSVLREFKYLDIGVVDATLNAAREHFDLLAGLRDRKTFEDERSLTASRISLVHEDDLEFSIRLSDLAQQIREGCEQPLGQLHLRFMTLLDQKDAAPEQLPIGPETIGCSLRALALEAKLTGDARVRMLQDMRSVLIRELRALYERLNTRLAEMGIVPKSLSRTPVQNLRSHSTNSTPEHAIDSPLAGALRERMIAWLDEQLAQGESVPQIARQLSRTQLAGLLPIESKAAVDCVEQALDRIAHHADIPNAAKQALEGLRIPYQKLALRDATLATQADHPARQLLTSLAKEASELPPGAIPGTTQLNQIEASVSRLAREYVEDASVFSDALNILESSRQARLDALTRLVDVHAEDILTEDRKEVSRRHASKAVRALCAQTPPRTIQFFLEHYWCIVLRNTLATYGEHSNEWTQALKTADGLINSVQPKPDAAAREHLATLLPRLTQRLRSGLDAIRIAPKIQDRLLERFALLHAEVLAGRDPLLVEPEVTAPAVEETRLDAISGTSGLQIMRRPGYQPREPEIPAALSKLGIGQNVVLLLPNGTLCSGSVAAISPSRQIFIIQVRPDNSLLAVSWAELVRQHDRATLRYSQPPVLFD